MPNVRQAIQEHLDDIGWSTDQLVKALDGRIASSAVQEFVAGTATLNTRELGLVMDALGLDFTATPDAPQRTRPRIAETPQPARISREELQLTTEEIFAELNRLMHTLEVTRYLGQRGDQQILIEFKSNTYSGDPQFASFVRVMQHLGGARFNNRRFTIPVDKAPAILVDAIVS